MSFSLSFVLPKYVRKIIKDCCSTHVYEECVFILECGYRFSWMGLVNLDVTTKIEFEVNGESGLSLRVYSTDGYHGPSSFENYFALVKIVGSIAVLTYLADVLLCSDLRFGKGIVPRALGPSPIQCRLFPSVLGTLSQLYFMIGSTFVFLLA
ncbi:hypothetical protein V6N11_031717 [Hibiscus sabdariffa]|uniref:Uncharacterized protein n=1 Tax=Hibiscus sabdariffa TaxID=183260 RepID=A0ABR2SZ78_9ROSI